MNKPFTNIIVPAITPYLDDLSLDKAGVEKVFAHFDELPDLDGLFITGATGEYDVLSLAERKYILDLAIDMNLQKDWVPNTTTLDQQTSMELTEYAASRGIGTIGVILPQECRTLQDVQIFLQKLLSYGVSIFIYQTGNSPYPLSADEMGQVIQLGDIVGIKDSCSPRDFYRHLRYISDYGDQIKVIQGVEMLYLSSLAMGGHGVIGGGCNVYPKLLRDVRDLYLDGRNEEAAAVQKRVNQLVELLYREGTGNEAMKYYLTLCGVEIGWASRKAKTPLSETQKIVMQDMYAEIYGSTE